MVAFILLQSILNLLHTALWCNLFFLVNLFALIMQMLTWGIKQKKNYITLQMLKLQRENVSSDGTWEVLMPQIFLITSIIKRASFLHARGHKNNKISALDKFGQSGQRYFESKRRKKGKNI